MAQAPLHTKDSGFDKPQLAELYTEFSKPFESQTRQVSSFLELFRLLRTLALVL